MVNWLIGMILLAIIVCIIIRGIRRVKRGQFGCNCGCSGCPSRKACSQKLQKRKIEEL